MKIGFAILKYIDPKGSNYERFKHTLEVIQLAVYLFIFVYG